jgi:hypothetical protein
MDIVPTPPAYNNIVRISFWHPVAASKEVTNDKPLQVWAGA